MQKSLKKFKINIQCKFFKVYWVCEFFFSKNADQIFGLLALQQLGNEWIALYGIETKEVCKDHTKWLLFKPTPIGLWS